MEHFDLIVIGAGPGGYTAALEACSLNKKVLLIENNEVGGTCLNRGCIPTKALLRSAKLFKDMLTGEELGIDADNKRYNFNLITNHAKEIKDKLREGILSLIKRGKITLVNGYGKVTDEHIVSVNDVLYEGDNIILATGSVPSIPPIPGLDNKNVITSDDLLNDKGIDLKSITIIGGGVVGVEFAQIYNDLGAKVTIIEALPRLLCGLSRELGQGLNLSFKKRGIETFLDAKVTSVTKEDDELICSFTDKKGEHEVKSQYVLVCTGRCANTKDLLDNKIADRLDLQKGYIPTNEYGMTNIKNIYAIGDIVLGGIQLAHMAEAQGKNSVSYMYGNEEIKDTKFVPSCIFTDPEIACVGISSEKAKEMGIDALSKKNLSTSNGKAIIDGADRGFIKLIYKKDDETLIGAELMCPHASEMIGSLTALIRVKATIKDVEKTIYPHPTVSEVTAL